MDIKDTVRTIAQNAQEASRRLARISCPAKNNALLQMAAELIKNTDHLIAENDRDVVDAKIRGLSKAMLDRLTLKKETIEGWPRACGKSPPCPIPWAK